MRQFILSAAPLWVQTAISLLWHTIIIEYHIKLFLYEATYAHTNALGHFGYYARLIEL